VRIVLVNHRIELVTSDSQISKVSHLRLKKGATLSYLASRIDGNILTSGFEELLRNLIAQESCYATPFGDR
jgi:hypothetical protein